ncbi:MAG: PLP-dependent aminotransferase family protein [Silicimonas sp.]
MIETKKWFETIADRKGPKYVAIVNALSDAIHRGDLAAGDRLPPQRDLAKLIGVTPGTTARAYAIASKRGLIVGETGRGTHVTKEATFPKLFQEPKPPLQSTPFRVPSVYTRSREPSPQLRNLALPRAPSPRLLQTMSTGLYAIAPDALKSPSDYQRYLTDFSPRHYDLGAEWMRQMGFKATAENVMLTAGAHIGISLILAFQNLQTMPLLTSSVTYGGMRNLNSINNRPMVEIDHDLDGIVPTSLEAACRRGMGKLLFMQTAVHNPLSVVTPPYRREEIAGIAQRYDLIVIEDNAALVAPMNDGPSIAELAPERTFLVSSTSKSITPSAPVGIILGPPGWVSQLLTSVRMHHLYPSVLNYALLEWMLMEGVVKDIWSDNVDVVTRRGKIASDIIGHEHFRHGPLSHYGWLSLPDEWHPDAFSSAMHQAGIEVGSSREFSLRNAANAEEGIRISLTGPETDEELTENLEIVAQHLKNLPVSP